MRLRNKMVPSDHEHQLKLLVYTLERASELADEAGVTHQITHWSHHSQNR